MKRTHNEKALRENFKFAFYGFIVALIFVATIWYICPDPSSVKYDVMVAEKNAIIENHKADILELNKENWQLRADNINLTETNKDLAAEIIWLESKITRLNNSLEATGNFVYDYSKLKDHSKDIIALCKVTLGEAGCCSDIQKAAVVWCVLNRVDINGKSIYQTATDKNQFHGYNEKWVVREEELMIVLDVLCRWQNEKITGQTDPGRVLPQQYIYFASSGKDENGLLTNRFRDKYDFNTANYWDFDCWNPYE